MLSDVVPSPALMRFAERQLRMASERERRSQQRHFFAEPVAIQPVDCELQPVEAPLAGVTRDISPGGIGLIVEGPFEHKRAAIRFSVDGETFCLLIEILWDRPLEPFVHVGGQVLRELQRLP